MEEQPTLIESLLERVEAYTKSNVDLLKLKAIDKSADVYSSLVSKLVLIIVIIIAITLVNIGLSMWIGGLIGKPYLGFFIVAAFYVLVAIIVHFGRESLIKTPVSNSFIEKMLKK